MKKWMIGIVTLTILALVLPGAAIAQGPVECADTYVVQTGDTLAAIADQLYENAWAYPVLVFATNQAAAQGGEFQTIADPNLIEPGWTLCVPDAETAAEGLDARTIRNLTYTSEWTADGTAALVNGEYSESAAPGSATKTVVRLHDRMAFGYTAGGEPFAAVILITDPGGSGTFYELAVLTFKDGAPVHVASVALGDRVKIHSLAISEGQIVVEMTTHGPEDPMCCPSLYVEQRYVLQGEALVEVTAWSDLIGVVWEWERFVGGDDSIIEVDDPAKYTLTLNPDGTYQVLADCNRAGGGYTLDEAHLTLLPGPMTAAECGTDSLYDEFVAKLGDVRTYVRPEGSDQLVLNLFADAGNMWFRPVRPELPQATGVVDKVWQWAASVEVESGDETEVEAPEQYTLTFRADGTFELVADCNVGGGSYSIEPGILGTLAMELGRLTRAACGPESRSQEWVDALAEVQGFRLSAEGDELRLVLPEEGTELVFLLAEPIALDGTIWTLASYRDDSGDLATVLDETEITATFKEGRMSGLAGCNNYFADYELDGEALSFGPAGATRKMCGVPDGIMEQEQAYLGVLESVAGYRIEDARLELLDDEGGVLATFEVQEPAE